MRHHPTVFEDLLREVPWGMFDRLVRELGSDAGVRSFTSRDHLIALLGAALGGFNGLRQASAGLAPSAGPLRLMGSEAPRRSTLAEANRRRSAELFVSLLQAMLPQANRQLRRDVREAVRLIDATQLDAGLRLRRWLGLHRGQAAAKLHIVYDPRAVQPVLFQVAPARINDITVAKTIPIEPGATYVFDLGYYDFGWWARLDRLQCRFVTRLKSHTRLHDIEERPVAAAADIDILADRTGRLPERMAAQRRNPFDKRVREIVVRIATGKTLRLLTNDLDSPAETIAALYKERWQIELFFKWIKQNLRIARFMGTSENAVRCQIATALIAFLLVRLAQARALQAYPATIIILVIRSQLFTRKPIQHLLHPPTRPKPPPNPQLRLFPCKT